MTALGFHDHQLAGRAVIAYLDGDQAALTIALEEATHDGADGLLGFVLAILNLTSEVLVASAGSPAAAADQLRAALADLTSEAIRRGDHDQG